MGTDRTVGIAVSESALLPPKYSFSTFLICFFSFSLSFFVRSSYFFWLRSASFWAFSFLASTFFLRNTNIFYTIHTLRCTAAPATAWTLRNVHNNIVLLYLFCIIWTAAALSKYWSTCDFPCMAANCMAVRKSKSIAHKLTSKPTKNVTQLKWPLDAARCNAFCPIW